MIKECNVRESNPGLPRGRREFYHWTNVAWELFLISCIYTNKFNWILNSRVDLTIFNKGISSLSVACSHFNPILAVIIGYIFEISARWTKFHGDTEIITSRVKPLPWYYLRYKFLSHYNCFLTATKKFLLVLYVFHYPFFREIIYQRKNEDYHHWFLNTDKYIHKTPIDYRL